MLQIVWLLVTLGLASLAWAGNHLWWAGGGFFMAGVSGLLILRSKYIIGLIGIIITAVIFLGSSINEPDWLQTLTQSVTFR